MRITGKYILVAIGLLFLMKITSCEPENWQAVDCNDCLNFKPDSADLIVQVTLNSENDSIPLTFYKGKVEDGVIDWRDTATSTELYLYSKVGQVYSVKATYKSGNETIIAIDSDKMRTTSGNEDCGSPCYIVKGGNLDLRLMN
jgi:hypothetical protein